MTGQHKASIRKKGRWLRVTIVLVIGIGALGSPTAHAKDDESLRKPIHVVQRKLFIKGLRFEVTPRGGAIFNDAFINTYTFGGDLFFHLNEWFSIGGYFLSTHTSNSLNTEVLLKKPFELSADRSEIKHMGMGEIQWTPIYNKASLLGLKVLHYDFYFSASAGMLWATLHRTYSVTPTAENEGREFEFYDSPSPVSHLAFSVGFGARIFVTKWMSVRLDIKDIIYRDGVGGQQEGTTGPTDAIQSTLHRVPVTLGVSFFFPDRE